MPRQHDDDDLTWNGGNGARERTQDARHLRVLVDEEERVGHVAIAEVNDREADPTIADGALHRLLRDDVSTANTKIDDE